MSFLKPTIAVAFGFAVQVASHGHPLDVHCDGKSFEPFQPYQFKKETLPTVSWRVPNLQKIPYVTPSSYGNLDINCHVGATPGDEYVDVVAGHDLAIKWTPWPVSHHGPIINYLGNCNGDCTHANKADIKWNKISAGGLLIAPKGDSDPGYWVSDALIKNDNVANVHIPDFVKSGNYLLRHEIIGLHGASHPNGAQNYPYCINLKVSGSGTDALPSGTKGVDLYTATDPGLLLSLYNPKLQYQMPGPPLYTGSEGQTASADNATVSPANAYETPAKASELAAKKTGPMAKNIDKPTPYSSTPAYPANAPAIAGSAHPSGTQSPSSPLPTGSGSTGKTTPKSYQSKPHDLTAFQPTTSKSDKSTTPKSEDSTTPKSEDYTTPKSEDYTTPKSDVDTTPKPENTTPTADSDYQIPAGASISQLRSIIDSCHDAMKKLSTKSRRHARHVLV